MNSECSLTDVAAAATAAASRVGCVGRGPAFERGVETGDAGPRCVGDCPHEPEIRDTLQAAAATIAGFVMPPMGTPTLRTCSSGQPTRPSHEEPRGTQGASRGCGARCACQCAHTEAAMSPDTCTSCWPVGAQLQRGGVRRVPAPPRQRSGLWAPHLGHASSPAEGGEVQLGVVHASSPATHPMGTPVTPPALRRTCERRLPWVHRRAPGSGRGMPSQAPRGGVVRHNLTCCLCRHRCCVLQCGCDPRVGTGLGPRPWQPQEAVVEVGRGCRGRRAQRQRVSGGSRNSITEWDSDAPRPGWKTLCTSWP